MVSKLFALALKVQAMRKSQQLYFTLSAVAKRTRHPEDRQKANEVLANSKAQEKNVDQIVSDILLADPNEKNQLELAALQIAQAMAALNRTCGSEECGQQTYNEISDAITVLQSAYLTATGKEAVKV